MSSPDKKGGKDPDALAAPWRWNRNPYYTITNLITVINRLPVTDRRNAVESARQHITLFLQRDEEHVERLYTLAERIYGRDFERPEHVQVWKHLRETAQRVRKRVQEGKRALAGEFAPACIKFYNEVIHPLIRDSTISYNALRQALGRNGDVINVLRKACREFYER